MKVRCLRDDVLEDLRKNEQRHLAAYEKAFAGYREAVKRWASDLAMAAASGGEFEASTRCPHQRPVSRADEYRRVIARLAASVDDEIELEESEFDCYVLDEWDWKPGVLDVFRSYDGLHR